MTRERIINTAIVLGALAFIVLIAVITALFGSGA
jgi:hypothetical protein